MPRCRKLGVALLRLRFRALPRAKIPQRLRCVKAFHWYQKNRSNNKGPKGSFVVTLPGLQVLFAPKPPGTNTPPVNLRGDIRIDVHVIGVLSAMYAYGVGCLATVLQTLLWFPGNYCEQMIPHSFPLLYELVMASQTYLGQSFPKHRHQ